MTENVDVAAVINKAFNERGFHICCKLGEGAYGEVVKAKCQKDDKFYAIKIVPLPVQGNTKYHKRELELLTKLELSGRNVIKYFASWIVPAGGIRQLCIQMELCSVRLGTFIYENDMGGPEIIKADGPPRFYQKVFPQILNGLDAIHSIGWVHRDLHPGNILIANPHPQHINDILVKIADFGLARYIQTEFEMSPQLSVVSTLEKVSPGVGHELFRAPELSNEKYDSKVDIYSSGVILYVLNYYIPNKNHVRNEILAFRQEQRGFERLHHQDERLFNLIAWLLQKEPNQRPTAAEAFAYMQRDNHTDENPTELPTKKFMVKKRGHDTYYRCSSNDTLSSIKKAIEEHPRIRIKADLQDLQQKNTIGNEEVLVGITSDQDVQEMFKSAEDQRKRVVIIVSKTDGGMEL